MRLNIDAIDCGKEFAKAMLGMTLALLVIGACAGAACGCSPTGLTTATKVVDAGIKCWQAVRDAELFACSNDDACKAQVKDKWAEVCSQYPGQCEADDDAAVIAGPQE